MIKVPASVLAYYQQPDVQTAVKLLLSAEGGRKKSPATATLRWKDIPDYYRALLAARQSPVEFAIFVEALWRQVWTDIPAIWKASAKPGDPPRPDLSVDVANIWLEKGFGRQFKHRDFTLELYAYLTLEDGFQLGMSLGDEEADVILSPELLDGWTRDDDYDTFWTQEEVVPLAEAIPIEPFRKWTDQAWQAIAAAVAAARW